MTPAGSAESSSPTISFKFPDPKEGSGSPGWSRPGEWSDSSQENFVRIQPKTLIDSRQVFVPPAGFRDTLASTQQRIYIVEGKAQSGRTITAVNLAIRIAESEGHDLAGTLASIPVFIYQRSGRPLRDLNPIIKKAQQRQGFEIYILDDAFKWGLETGSLSENFEFYHQELTRTKAYIIVTTDQSVAPKGVKCQIFYVRDVSPQEVYKTHLRYYFERISADDPTIQLLQKNKQVIFEHIETPKLMGIFFDRVYHERPKADEDIKELAQRISGRGGSATRRWFRELDFNTKIFAMLMALLSEELDVSFYDVEELYVYLVQKLRQKQGMDGENILIDPRRIGIEDIASRATVNAKVDHIISFIHESTKQSILEEEIRNYHGVLWTVAETLADLMTVHLATHAKAPLPGEALITPDYWIDNPDLSPLTFAGAGEVTAYLVGKIGVFRQQKLQDLMARMAEYPDRYINQLAAWTLYPVACDPNRHPFLLEQLNDWLPTERKSERQQPALENTNVHPNHVRTASELLALIYARVQRLAAERAESSAQATAQKLSEFIDRMSEVCGSYHAYLDAYKVDERARINRLIKEALQKNSNVTPPSEEEKDEYIQQAACVELLNVVGNSLDALIYIIYWVSQTHPQDIVKIVNQWLQPDFNAANTSFEEMEDHLLERVLTIDDTMSDADIKYMQGATEIVHQQRKHRLRNLKQFVGVLAARYLFFVASVQPDPGVKKGKSESSVAEEDENEEQKNVAASDQSNASIERADDEDHDDETQNKSATNGADEEDADDTPSSAEQGKTKQKIEPTKEQAQKSFRWQQDNLADNLIDIQKRFLPLLELLPFLLKAATNYRLTINDFIKLLGERYPDFQDILPSIYEELPADHLCKEVEFLLNQLPLLDTAFDAIQRWYKFAGDTEQARQLWINTVFPKMLLLVNYATQAERGEIRAALFKTKWITAREDDIRNIGHALLARSYILDGMVTDLPANRYGVVLLDGSQRAETNQDRWPDYNDVFQLLQRLSVVAPVKVYHMGSTELLGTVGTSNTDMLKSVRNLRSLRRHSRMMMPFFEQIPGAKPILDVDTTPFVLILRQITEIFPDVEEDKQEDVIDLLDVLSMAGSGNDPAFQKILLDPFATTKEKEQANISLHHTDWPWRGKIILFANGASTLQAQFQQAMRQFWPMENSRHGSPTLSSFFQIMDLAEQHQRSIEQATVEDLLSQRITQHLHNVPSEKWAEDLTTCTPIARFSMENLAAMARQLEEWIEQLDDVTEAKHPRDITLTITWTILTISRFDLEKAVRIVQNWLQSSAEPKQQIGIACTRLLFSFYTHSQDLISQHTKYEPLLQLLAPFTEIRSDATEIMPIFHILLVWAYETEWSQRLLSPPSDGDSELLTCLRKLRRLHDSALLQRIVLIHEALLAFSESFAAADCEWDEFAALIQEIDKQVAPQVDQPPNDRKGAAATSQNIYSKQQLSWRRDAEQVVRYLYQNAHFHFQESHDLASRLLVWLRPNIIAMHTTDRKWLRAARTNLKALTDAIRLQFYTRTNLALPILSNGKKYGVVLVSVGPNAEQSSRDAIGFVRYFNKLAKENNVEHVVLTIHRIGRTEVVYSHRQQPPKRRELRPDGIPHFAPLISPVLERYALENVAFFLVITTEQPVDLGDWVDDMEYRNKVWIYQQRPKGWAANFFGSTMATKQVKNSIIELTNEMVQVIKS